MSKRYSVSMPDDVYERLQNHADEAGSTVNQLIRQFLKLGLIVLEIDKSADRQIVIRNTSENNDPDEILKIVF